MELTDKALANKTFTAAKQAHDDAVNKGAKCGPQCGIFHKAASGTTKSYERARTLLFLHQLGRDI